MMKKIFLASFLISTFISPQTATWAKTYPIYNFSAPLLNAVKNCYKYNEEFTKINPDLTSSEAICQRFNIRINGIMADNLCHASVTHKTQDMGKTVYKCKLSRAERNELYQAMLNQSAEPITSTFSIKEEYEDENGKLHQALTPMTMTDTAFNIALTKLKHNACTSDYEEPNESEQKLFNEYVLTFSENFQNKLKTCTSAQEYIKTPYLSKPIKIIGKEANTCVIDSGTFIYHIPMSDIYKLTNYDQLSTFAADPQIAKYVSTPDLRYGLFALSKCLKEEDDYQSPIQNQMINNIQMTKQTTSHNQDQDCVLKFMETVSRPDYYEAYETVCIFPKAEVKELLAPYQKILAKASQTQISQTTQNAAQKLYDTLNKKGYCHLNSL